MRDSIGSLCVLPLLLTAVTAVTAVTACPAATPAPSPGPDCGPDVVVDTGDPGATDVTPDAPPARDLGPPPAPTELTGWVRLIEQLGGGDDFYAEVETELWATPLPTSQQRVAEEGDCVLLHGAVMDPMHCEGESGCMWGAEICVEGKCVPYPDRAPSGNITVSAGGAELLLTPNAEGAYTLVGQMPDDLFAPGDAVVVTSTGGNTPALDLAARGVDDLIADVWSYGFEPGEDLVVTWQAGCGQAARVQLLLRTGWHGSPSQTTIWCESDDDGELVVPANLTAQFPIPSCGECEGSTLTRFTRDVVDFGAGPIELLVGSQRWFVAWWGGY
jgi:hypothetical protein